MVRLCLGIILIVAQSGCGGAGDDGECMPAPGCYRAILGVGTGNCNAEMLLSSLGTLPTITVSELDMCEQIDIGSVTVSGSCTGTGTATAELSSTGPSAGSLAVDADCPASGGDCQHAFSLSFAEVDCATTSAR